MKKVRKFLDKWGHFSYLFCGIISFFLLDYTMASLMICLFLLELSSRQPNDFEDETPNTGTPE